MFEIGDIVKNVFVGAKRYGQKGEVVALNEDGKEVVVEYIDGDIGGGKKSSFINLTNGDSTATPIKTKMNSIVNRIADAFRSEPEKTYRALGIKDSSGNLTAEGKDLLLSALFDANEETLIRPQAIKLLEAEKKNK
jgi:hypothetical protein